MAQFRATIRGQRGSASRLGSKSSGLTAYVNGWDGGVVVQAMHYQGQDRFRIFASGGSNATSPEKYLGYVDEKGKWHSENSALLEAAKHGKALAND